MEKIEFVKKLSYYPRGVAVNFTYNLRGEDLISTYIYLGNSFFD